jgi:hypothetical protein
MKRWQKGLLGSVATIGLAAALVPPVAAQERGGIAVRPPRGLDLGVRRDSRGDPPLFAPFSSGAIERNFAIMRDTSPNPRAYMGGQLNPRHSSVRFGYRRDGLSFGLGYSYSHYDYSFGYCPPLYPGYVYYPVPPTLYPWGYAVPSAVTPLRERVVIIQAAAPEARREPAREQPRREESDRQERMRGDSDYYLSPRAEKGDEGLVDALLEIRKAWLNGDHARLKARIRDGAKVRIYPQGKYEYSVTAADFAQMTHDAMSRLDTLSFELDAPRTLDEGRAFVSGTHTFKDADGEKRQVHVSYVLTRDEGRWYLAEAGSGGSPIRRHAE